jgi:hypothetical protein
MLNRIRSAYTSPDTVAEFVTRAVGLDLPVCTRRWRPLADGMCRLAALTPPLPLHVSGNNRPSCALSTLE